MEISCVRKFRKQFSWLYFLLCTFSVTFQSQSMDNPSPNSRLVKLSTGEFMSENSSLASELVIRLVAVVLKFSSFQPGPKTIVFLYVHHKIKYNCCFFFSLTELFIWFFFKESVAKGPSSMVRLLQSSFPADYRKNLLLFQIFNYSCFSTAATK